MIDAPLPAQVVPLITPELASFEEDFKLIVDIYLVFTNVPAEEIEKLHRLEVLQAL